MNKLVKNTTISLLIGVTLMTTGCVKSSKQAIVIDLNDKNNITIGVQDNTGKTSDITENLVNASAKQKYSSIIESQAKKGVVRIGSELDGVDISQFAKEASYAKTIDLRDCKAENIIPFLEKVKEEKAKRGETGLIAVQLGNAKVDYSKDSKLYDFMFSQLDLEKTTKEDYKKRVVKDLVLEVDIFKTEPTRNHDLYYYINGGCYRDVTGAAFNKLLEFKTFDLKNGKPYIDGMTLKEQYESFLPEAEDTLFSAFETLKENIVYPEIRLYSYDENSNKYTLLDSINQNKITKETEVMLPQLKYFIKMSKKFDLNHNGISYILNTSEGYVKVSTNFVIKNDGSILVYTMLTKFR